MRIAVYWFTALAYLAGSTSFVTAQSVPTAKPPSIRHDPLTVAIPGQPLTIRAHVSADPAAGTPEVSVLYSVSKDAAPFRVKMDPSGAGLYIGTIPGSVLAQVSNLSYYVEATDKQGATAETAWYSVSVGAPTQPLPVPPPTPRLAQPPTPKTSNNPEESSRSWWKSPAVWIGGAALAAGVAIAANSGGGGSDSNDSNTDTPAPAITNAGTYAGSLTECLQMGSAPPRCESRSIIINVSRFGLVSTDNLRTGVHLETALSGSSFTLTSSVAETNLTGEIRYRGIILDGRITGSVEGSAFSTSGTNGTYYGNFSAALR